MTSLYRDLGEWEETAEILELVRRNQRDPWGTTPIFFYTLAYCERRAGRVATADEALKEAHDASGKSIAFRTASKVRLRSPKLFFSTRTMQWRASI